eukprot:gnl/MRDRNA2_/MRDRNA2_31902_c0_seq1.p1 gnl/MRDRNA2_/MRDRNA2_31902_c0~~gnl/MRDRNA2_/MRDRNA2_31902_c0_seq1.p1  ORF type:complete len:316 (-),score=44.97 gnl/MRDRNA2_/MRDRNA2_31902_c0_seq1:91-1038(-)
MLWSQRLLVLVVEVVVSAHMESCQMNRTNRSPGSSHRRFKDSAVNAMPQQQIGSARPVSSTQEVGFNAPRSGRPLTHKIVKPFFSMLRSSRKVSVSKPVPVPGAFSTPGTSTPIKGLALVQLGETSTVQAALAELRPWIADARVPCNKSSAMLELGWSFKVAEIEGKWRVKKPIAQFPRTRNLIMAAMKALGEEQIFEERLNVIVRRYTTGHNIPMHHDRKDMFAEDVYSCVLLNTSDQVLTFRKQQKDGKIIQEHKCPEKPGMAARQRGEARFVWSHGVDTVKHGERFSVTWRWFAPDYVPTKKLARVNDTVNH